MDGLTLDQHLALLRYLCDTALESERMRGILQRERRLPLPLTPLG